MANRNTITLYGEIGVGRNTSAAFKERLALANRDERLIVKLDTVGGNVLDGIGIRDAISEWPAGATVVVEPVALSIGSYVLTGADRVEMSQNGYIMVHNPTLGHEGDDEEFERAAGLLKKMKAQLVKSIADRTGKEVDEVTSMLKQETWIDANEALEMGLVDALIDPAESRSVTEDKLPAKVVASLKVSGRQAGESTLPVGKNMSINLAKHLKAKWGKAVKAEFIAKAVEVEMTPEQADEEMLKELLAENDMLKAQLVEKDEELAAAKAEMEKKPVEAPVAKSTGVKPVARLASPGSAGGTSLSAKARWDQAISAKLSTGMDKAKALSAVNRENPGLRQEMLDEVNS